MYAHSISDFSLTNDSYYYDKKRRGDVPRSHGKFKKEICGLSMMSKALGMCERVRITHALQQQYIKSNNIQLWDLLCMARMANTRMIGSSSVLFKIKVFNQNSDQSTIEILKIKLNRSWFGKNKITIMLPNEK